MTFELSGPRLASSLVPWGLIFHLECKTNYLGVSVGPVALPNGHRSAIAIGRY